MPTHEELARFLREHGKLSDPQQDEFALAVEKMVADLRGNAGFRPSLRVKAVQGHPGVFEMTWAPDGRATFSYGPPHQQGQAHVVWRRIGGHEILRNP